MMASSMAVIMPRERCQNSRRTKAEAIFELRVEPGITRCLLGREWSVTVDVEPGGGVERSGDRRAIRQQYAHCFHAFTMRCWRRVVSFALDRDPDLSAKCGV